MKFFISTIYLFVQMGMQIYSDNVEQNVQLEQQYFVTQSEYVTQSDFELVGGLIFVEAGLNGKKEKFILDTGSAHFLLNENQEKQKRRKSNLWMNGVGGNKKMAKVRGVDFDWEGITAKRNVMYAVDLNNIVKAKKRDFAGLIGYDQVRSKELVLDYENQKLFLLSRKNKDFFNNHNRVDKVRFRMVNHLPVVKVKIGKKNYYFAIDTGAETNVIDKRLKNKIPKELIEIGFMTNVASNDSLSMEVYGMELQSIKVGKTQYDHMPFIFTDLSFLNMNTDFRIDGLLGYQFLRRGKFSINYRKKQLNKWELKNKRELKPKLISEKLLVKSNGSKKFFKPKTTVINPLLTSMKFKLIKKSFSIIYNLNAEEQKAEFTFSGS